jgi:hypothetical protein
MHEGSMMPRRRRTELPEHADMILGYFLRHREAADTIEGVARWRLMEESVHRNVEETQTAIKWLVAEGFLLEESPRGAQQVFRLNEQRAAQAGRLLRGATRRRRDDPTDA